MAFYMPVRERATLAPGMAAPYTHPIMCEYMISRAQRTLADSEALLAVERRTLCDSPYSPTEVLQVLQRPEHYTYLAYSVGHAIGFCSCFETASGTGMCLEIDMLGVLPEHQSRGVGGLLLRRCLDEARCRDTDSARAVVADDNVASQKAFERAGLGASSDLREMLVYEILGDAAVPFLPLSWAWHRSAEGRFVWQEGGRCAEYSASGHSRSMHRIGNEKGSVALAEVIQVETVSYRGLWVEKLLADSEAALGTIARALVEEAKALNLDQVGYLWPIQESQADDDWRRISLVREGYQSVGVYRVYGLEWGERAQSEG